MRKIILFLIANIALFSCSKQESDFVGHDAHIVAFTLTQNGTKYAAELSGTNIILTVPTDVNLNGAKVEYELCENASILPDPASITNWNEDHTFRIQSWNEEYKGYNYVIVRSNIENADNVILATQTQVDEFAQKRINKIDGNLIIGSSSKDQTDPVKDLSGLSALTEVSFNVVIKNGFAGETFSGLENLIRVGGLYIGSEIERSVPMQKFNLELPALQQATQVIVNCDSLTSISLPALKSVSNLYLNSISILSLDLSQLENVFGNMTIMGNTGGKAETESNLVLSKLSFPTLKYVTGNLLIENFWGVDKLELKTLEKVDGDLNIKYVRTAKSISMPMLTDVLGNFNIQANDGMTKLAAPQLKAVKSLTIASVNMYSINLKNINMVALERVAGDFKIQFFGGLKFDFPSLVTIEGKLNLMNMQFIESVEMPKLADCNNINIQTVPMLESFDASKLASLKTLSITGCKSLALFKTPKEITGDVTLSGGNAVCKFTHLQGLETIGGKLSVGSYNNTELEVKGVKNIGSYTQTSGSNLVSLTLSDVTAIGDITLSGMTKLESLSMPKLIHSGALNIKGLLLLKVIDFAKLSTINGTFTFYGGSYASQASQSKTENLNGFSAVTSVNKVDIRYAGALSDFSGLKNALTGLSASNWNVQNCAYNPTYEDMTNGKYTNN